MMWSFDVDCEDVVLRVVCVEFVFYIDWKIVCNFIIDECVFVEFDGSKDVRN